MVESVTKGSHLGSISNGLDILAMAIGVGVGFVLSLWST